MSPARINFPLYTIINSPGEVMFCRTSEGAAMTLFTSDENLKLFSERSEDLQPVVTIAVIENKEELATILRKPSSKAKKINNSSSSWTQSRPTSVSISRLTATECWNRSRHGISDLG